MVVCMDMVGGNELTGFPFTASDKIRSSPAGDENDGSNELVFDLKMVGFPMF